MDPLLSFFKAMGDETRLKLMILLTHQSHCVCELSEILDLSQPKISKHLSKLKDLGFVETTREAQYIFYQINKTHPVIEKIVKSIMEYAKTDAHMTSLLDKVPQCTIELKKGNA
jgi:ArsR family transcriptional regulator, arsenate/arsenite/antimonite-responsive transcriptional repressor